MTVVLDQETFKSPLKQMATPLMPTVEPDGIAYAQPLDRSREIGLFGSNQEVIVVFH
jgi:hypothetical protein